MKVLLENMKNLFKLAYKVCICIIFLVFINILFIRTNFWKNQNDVYKFSQLPDNITLINLGSSHGQCAFNYSDCTDVTAYNCALSAQPFYYDLQVLKQYHKKLKQNAVILIPVSYFSFYQTKAEFEAIKLRYYRILPNRYIIDADLLEDFKYSLFPISSQGRFIKRIIKDIPASEVAFCTSELQQKTVSADEIGTIAKAKFSDRFSLNRQTVSEEEFSLNYNSFVELLDFCFTHNYRVVLLTTPLTNELYTLFSREYLAEFKNVLSGALKTYQQIEYWDYAQYQPISSNLSFFRDSDHLNDKGALEFTRIIISRLKEKKYL